MPVDDVLAANMAFTKPGKRIVGMYAEDSTGHYPVSFFKRLVLLMTYNQVRALPVVNAISLRCKSGPRSIPGIVAGRKDPTVRSIVP